MTHSEAVSTIKQLAPRFREEGVEETLVKYARANDLSPAQLGKLGQTYNTVSALSTYERSPDRGATSHQVEVPKMVAEFADTPMRKAATHDPLPTHGEHIDLHNLFRHSLNKEREQIPDEVEKDRKEDAEKRQGAIAEQTLPDTELLKAAADDLDTDLDTQAYLLLRTLRKQAGVYDLSDADEDARYKVESRYVDAAMSRIRASAADQPVAAQVKGFSGDLVKRAFVTESDASRAIVDMAVNAAALDKVIRMMKEATKNERPKGKEMHKTDPSKGPSATDAESEAPKKSEGGGVAVAEDDRGHLTAEERRYLDEGPDYSDPEVSPVPSAPAPKSLLDLFKAPEASPDKPVSNPNNVLGRKGQAMDEQEVDTPADVDYDAIPLPQPAGAPTHKNPPTPPTKDTQAKDTQGKDTEKPWRAVLDDVATTPNKGQTLGQLLGKALDVPARAAVNLQNMLANGATAAQRHIAGITDKDRVNHAQSRSDRSVEDVRRGFLLRRVIHTDPVLSEANPHKVAKYYNELADAYPDLATSPDSLRLLLREAVAYDGLPLETIKNLTSTRLDSARAAKEEHELRKLQYKI